MCFDLVLTLGVYYIIIYYYTIISYLILYSSFFPFPSISSPILLIYPPLTPSSQSSSSLIFSSSPSSLPNLLSLPPLPSTHLPVLFHSNILFCSLLPFPILSSHPLFFFLFYSSLLSHSPNLSFSSPILSFPIYIPLLFYLHIFPDSSSFPNHSIRVGTWIRSFIFHQYSSQPNNSTPHVLSEWMVEVWGSY